VTLSLVSHVWLHPVPDDIRHPMDPIWGNNWVQSGQSRPICEENRNADPARPGRAAPGPPYWNPAGAAL